MGFQTLQCAFYKIRVWNYKEKRAYLNASDTVTMTMTKCDTTIRDTTYVRTTHDDVERNHENDDAGGSFVVRDDEDDRRTPKDDDDDDDDDQEGVDPNPSVD